jgi:hypothetical protein
MVRRVGVPASRYAVVSYASVSHVRVVTVAVVMFCVALVTRAPPKVKLPLVYGDVTEPAESLTWRYPSSPRNRTR